MSSGDEGRRDDVPTPGVAPAGTPIVEPESNSGELLADASTAKTSRRPFQLDAMPAPMFPTDLESDLESDSEAPLEALSEGPEWETDAFAPGPCTALDPGKNEEEEDATVADAPNDDGMPGLKTPSAIPEALDLSTRPFESPSLESLEIDSGRVITIETRNEPPPDPVPGTRDADAGGGDRRPVVFDMPTTEQPESLSTEDIAVSQREQELAARPSKPPTVFDLNQLDFQDADAPLDPILHENARKPKQNRSVRLASKFRETSKPAPGSSAWNVGLSKDSSPTTEEPFSAEKEFAAANPTGEVTMRTYRPTGMSMDELVQIVGPVLKAARSGGVRAYATRSEAAIVVTAPEEVHAAVDRLVTRFGESPKEAQWSAELLVARCAVNDPMQGGLSFNRLNIAGAARGFPSGLVSPLELGETPSLGLRATSMDQMRVGVAAASLPDLLRLFSELTTLEVVARRRLPLNPGQWVDIETTAAMAQHARGFGELYEQHVADYAGSGLKLKYRSRGVEGERLLVDIQPIRGSLASDAAASNGDRLRIDSSVTAELSSGQTVIVGGVYSFEAFRVTGRRNVVNAVLQYDANGTVYRVQSEWVALLAVHREDGSKPARTGQAATQPITSRGVATKGDSQSRGKTTGLTQHPNLASPTPATDAVIESALPVAAAGAVPEPETMTVPNVSRVAQKPAAKQASGIKPPQAHPDNDPKAAMDSAKPIQIMPQKPTRKPTGPVIIPKSSLNP
jgi:hypothetical protein